MSYFALLCVTSWQRSSPWLLHLGTQRQTVVSYKSSCAVRVDVAKLGIEERHSRYKTEASAFTTWSSGQL